MFEQIINSLSQSGWKLVALEGKWVSATHESLDRGLILGNLSELPSDFTEWIRPYNDISKWDVLVFCPEGINSSHLKQRRFPDIQLWYWDMLRGNLFPFPPTNDPLIPRWLKQLASGKPIISGREIPKREILPSVFNLYPYRAKLVLFSHYGLCRTTSLSKCDN